MSELIYFVKGASNSSQISVILKQNQFIITPKVSEFRLQKKTHNQLKSNDQTEILNLKDIQDIKLLKGNQIQLLKSIPLICDNQLRFHLSNKEEISLYIANNSNLIKIITDHWNCYLIQQSAKVKLIIPTSSVSLAEEYYFECLKTVRWAIDNNDSKQLEEILNEFSQEILYDLQLKELIFRSKEIILICINICKKSITVIKPEYTVYKDNRDDWLNHSETSMNHKKQINSNNNNNNFNSITNNELQIFLKNCAQNRIKIIHCIFKFLCYLFIGSENLLSRKTVLTGLKPFDMENWFDILIIDYYSIILLNFNIINIKTMTHDILINNELNKSINDRIQLNTITKSIKEKSMSFLDSLMTPVRKRVQELQNYDSNDNTNNNHILQLNQSLFDLQIIILFHINSINNSYNYIIIENEKISNNRYVNNNIVNIGELYIHNLNYEIHLENIVLRISSLLDNMLECDKISSYLQQKSYSIRQSMPDNMKNLNITSISPIKMNTNMNSDMKINMNMSVSMNTTSMNHISMNLIDEIQENDHYIAIPQSTLKYNHKRAIKNDSSKITELNNFNWTIIETQEILLFLNSSLLLTLAYSSSTIREILSNELKNYWYSINTVLKTLCPSKLDMTKTNMSDDRNDNDNDNDDDAMIIQTPVSKIRSKDSWKTKNLNNSNNDEINSVNNVTHKLKGIAFSLDLYEHDKHHGDDVDDDFHLPTMTHSPLKLPTIKQKLI